MLVCFFFNVESGIVMFLNTALLSQKTFIEPSMGMPNILSLYCNASICSTAVFMAMNSLPKVLVSTVFWCLLYHTTAARLTNNNNPSVISWSPCPQRDLSHALKQHDLVAEACPMVPSHRCPCRSPSSRTW